MRRNVWETDEPFVQVVQQDGKVYVRMYPKSGGVAPIVATLDVSEALGLAIDLTNKARIVVERTA